MNSEFDQLSNDPELGPSAAALREQWRLDEEEYVRAAEQHWAHQRSMIDIAREVMHRGDTVCIEVADATFRGVVAAVGDDYLQLENDSGGVDIRLTRVPVVVRVVDRARGGGRRTTPGSRTFRARLLEHEMAGADTVVGSWLTGGPHSGRILVGRDHVLVGPDVYVAMSWLAWVRSGVGTPGA